jgi:hypothetical protein
MILPLTLTRKRKAESAITAARSLATPIQSVRILDEEMDGLGVPLPDPVAFRAARVSQLSKSARGRRSSARSAIRRSARVDRQAFH